MVLDLKKSLTNQCVGEKYCLQSLLFSSNLKDMKSLISNFEKSLISIFEQLKTCEGQWNFTAGFALSVSVAEFLQELCFLTYEQFACGYLMILLLLIYLISLYCFVKLFANSVQFLATQCFFPDTKRCGVELSFLISTKFSYLSNILTPPVKPPVFALV